jgi:hypothetical protein
MSKTEELREPDMRTMVISKKKRSKGSEIKSETITVDITDKDGVRTGMAGTSSMKDARIATLWWSTIALLAMDVNSRFVTPVETIEESIENLEHIYYFW